MTKNRIGLLVVIGFATISLTACWDDAPKDKNGQKQAAAASGAQAARAVDPCSYITAAQVAGITTDTVTRVSAGKDSCKYHSDPDDGLEVEIHDRDGVKRMLTMRRTVKLLGGIGRQVADKGGAGADTERLLREDKNAPDIGDEAVWVPGPILAVRKGDFYVEVTPPIMHDPATHTGYPLIRADERRMIARKVAERILLKASN